MKIDAKFLARFFALFLVTLLLYVGLYVGANIFNYKISFLNINPPDETYEIPLTISHPPTIGTGFYIENSSSTIYIRIVLRYNGILAERQPILLSASGTLSPQLAEEVFSISVGFVGALPYSENDEIITIGSGWGISLKPTSKAPNIGISLGAGLEGSSEVISFPVQGDYYPIINIFYDDFTTVRESYELHRLHVSGAETLRQERYSRINTVLSLSVFLFACVEIIHLIFRLFPNDYFARAQ